MKSFIARKINLLIFLLCSSYIVRAQHSRVIRCNTTQSLSYQMKIDFKAEENKFLGYQRVIYRNTSPDTLKNIFYHLFYNAFQPGSAMQERGMHIRDQDNYAFTLKALRPDEIGYENIDSVKINDRIQPFTINRTILKISPLNYIAPGDSIVIQLWFKSQVPKMILRTGRDNPEKVEFTMTQWYPKIAAYDRAGWHTDQYIHREFYGPFADFDVEIRIDKKYKLAATGVLQDNNESVAHDYFPMKDSDSRVWHFKAANVHDFAWAADRTYKEITTDPRVGLLFHFYYKPETATVEDWVQMPEKVKAVFDWMEKKVGEYPYPQYSLVQGGSGGTEYPMLSMILGHRPQSHGMIKAFPIFTVAIHEIMHNWWYAVVANDENRNPWLDEGFALFFQYEYQDYLNGPDSLKKSIQVSYDQMLPPARLNAMEPMSTPSDYYDANWSYTSSAYHKGAVFLNQLRYIVGDDLFWKGIRKYYSDWSFGHPDGDDFIHSMEQASGIQLKWYLDLWTKTVKFIDYAVDTIRKRENFTEINLVQKGTMPMPLDVDILLKDGNRLKYNIPLVAMCGSKSEEGVVVVKAWSWTDPVYKLDVPVKYGQIKSVEIDPMHVLFDLNRKNNIVTLP